MDLFSVMIRDMVIIGVIASFAEMLLPESDIKHPVRLIFGLYFMALLLNPFVSLFTDTDLSDVDFGALAETRTMEIEEIYNEDAVYEQAAISLGSEIEGKLCALYRDCEAEAEIKMDAKGFSSVNVKIKGKISSEAIMTAEIQDLLCRDYGVPRDVIKVILERS